jgi:hypothetical protein
MRNWGELRTAHRFERGMYAIGPATVVCDNQGIFVDVDTRHDSALFAKRDCR